MRSPREFHPEMDAHDLEHRHERHPLLSVALVLAVTLAFGGMLRAALGQLATPSVPSGTLAKQASTAAAVDPVQERKPSP
jgi:hypothetical protein